jgi:hypothetical protein
MADKDAVVKWVRTAVIAGLGGGIAAIVATAADPQKYRFPQDLGTGKMWPYFLQGVALTLGAMLLKSPLGKQVMGAMRDAKAQTTDSQAVIDKAKSDLLGVPPGKPAEPPPTGPTPPAAKR